MFHLNQLLRRVLRAVLYGAVGSVVALLVVFVLYMNGRPDLDVWHTVDLDEEFTEKSPVTTFDEYLALEDRLFQQLDEQVYAQTAPGGPETLNRYQRGSVSDPQRWTPNWNRTQLLEAADPRAMVLLLHGLSDSPYSLHHMAKRLNAAGATVLALRIPGHGTAPSGLVTARWQDMAAAVRLAMRHLAKLGGGRPIHVVGYSNGAALAVHYALDTLDDPGLPAVDRLVLLSPEIGIRAAAALAVWQARLGHLLGLDKLAWNDILLEFEPFKYGSFAVNAGDLSHRITTEIQERITALEPGGKLSAMPPILAFSSAVDATVLAPALVSNLFNRLPRGNHELVLFDINRQAGIENILTWKPDAMLAALREAPHESYRLTIVSNVDRNSSQVAAYRFRGDGRDMSVEKIDLRWPGDVYSLSHVALPFPPDDGVYGGLPTEAGPGIHLGAIALRGERGALAISEAAQLRLRWNPFYSWMEDRAVDFLGLGDTARADEPGR